MKEETYAFTHNFTSEANMFSMDVEATGKEVIRIESHPDNKIWVSANKAGWLHLSRVCAELAMGDFSDGYHVHFDFEFRYGNPDKPEITLEKLPDEWPL